MPAPQFPNFSVSPLRAAPPPAPRSQGPDGTPIGPLPTADSVATALAYGALGKTPGEINVQTGEGHPYANLMDSRLWVGFYDRPVYDTRQSEGWKEIVYDPFDEVGVKLKHFPPGIYEWKDDGSGSGKGEFVCVAERGVKRARYKMIPYVKIQVPGELDYRDREVRESDKQRFVRQWDAYQHGQNQDEASGHLLTFMAEAGLISEAQIKELNYYKVVTVEHLADLSDHVCAQFMGAQELKRKAKHFLESLKVEEPKAELKAELEKRDKQIADQLAMIDQHRAQVTELKTQLEALQEQFTSPRQSPLAD